MLKLYNTLTRKKENFKPIIKGKASMYSCGPTVYSYQHIGNFRTMLLNDFLKRSLEYLGYKVNHVMNTTDVDDKTIRGSQKEGLTLDKLTKKYEKIFLNDLDALNIIRPKITRATEHIDDMVSMIKILLKKKYAYKTSDGIYFSIKKFKKYGKLAQLEKIKDTKARIGADEYDKENAQDFALWKFYDESDGDVFWDTDIGKGRPGWSIECSAMSTKNLGKHFDIHTGAIDLIFPHHTNEIAQSECATGEKFVNYWIHGGFLSVGEKMSKSLGNILTIEELKSKGFAPKHYRYFSLLTHYRKTLQFTIDNLNSAKNAYEKLKRKIIEIKKEEHKGNDKTKTYESAFRKAIEDDLNLPKAVQVFLSVLDDFDFDSKKKIKLLEKFDSVLGLDVKNMQEVIVLASKELEHLMTERENLRKEKKWAEADVLRERIREKGYKILDTGNGPKLEKI